MAQKSPRDRELKARGWTRQFSASRPRLDEAVQEYRELGFEVLVEPVETSPSDGACTTCIAENPEYVKVIYTRAVEGASTRQ
jgi:hypothetical protein